MYTQIKNRLILTGAALFLSMVSAHAVTNYVDRSYEGKDPTGMSWKSPFPSLQMAIDAVADAGGGEIWVKAGVYKPKGSSKNATFELKPNVNLYGGFRGTETERSQRIPRSNRTILSGDIGKPGTTSDNSFHVMTGASDCVVDGFILSRGNANAAAESRFGGALLVPPGTVNLKLANCTFEKNNAETGGAIHLSAAAISLTNCTFYSNSAKDGAAVAIGTGGILTATDSTFSSNFAPKSGGAVLMNKGTEAVFSGCTFMYNSTDGAGGAITARANVDYGINLKVENCKFSENSAKTTGGALAFSGPFTPLVKNSEFRRNFSKKGAGAIANNEGVTAIILNPVYAENRGSGSSPDFSIDSTSKLSVSADDLVAAAIPDVNASEVAVASTSSEEAEPAEKRQVPDVQVYNDSGLKVKLSSIVAANSYSVVVLGDLTDPAFIKNYQHIEAVARDYPAKGIGFFYIYKALKHPENNGYLKPFTQTERAQQSKVAAQKLQTRIPWLYDPMDNAGALALAPEGINSLFVYNREGEELTAEPMTKAASLRKLIQDLVGVSETLTTVDVLPAPLLEPDQAEESPLVKRIEFNTHTEVFKPLQITPQDSSAPFYVKLRAEGDKDVLETGDGKLYIGFHVDPLYNVAWNNMADPMKYTLKASKGVVAPSINSAPRVTGQATDAEPREFMLQARKLDLSQPLVLQVEYSIHSLKTKRNVAVQQTYLIYLQEDPFGGVVLGRQSDLKQEKEKASNASSAYNNMLRRYDLDRNGKLSGDEVIGGLRSNFPEIDTDSDGFITEDEYSVYRNKQ